MPAAPSDALQCVAVLGLGQIGGSLLRSAKAAGYDTVGLDVDADTCAAASVAGFAVADDVVSAVRDADAVVLAMPLPQVPDAVRSIAPHLPDGVVITDVGTLKAPVIECVREFAPSSSFVGGHPLAGVEETGWAASDAARFRDAPWSLTLEADTSLADWLRVAELVLALGAHPVPTTAAAQDAAVGRVIGLPHVLAEALALTGLAGGPLGLSLAAGSYLSGSRVARTRPELVATWCDGNPALVAALDDALAHLHEARDALAGGGSVLPLAREGHRARLDWEHRELNTVEVDTDPAALLELGRAGGWLTGIRRDDAGGIRVTARRPVGGTPG